MINLTRNSAGKPHLSIPQTFSSNLGRGQLTSYSLIIQIEFEIADRKNPQTNPSNHLSIHLLTSLFIYSFTRFN